VAWKIKLTQKRIISLRLKLGATALLIEFLTVALLTWYWVAFTQNHLAKEHQRSVTELVPVLQSALVTPLLEEDITTLKTILQPLITANNGHIKALTISNRSGDVLWSINATAFVDDQTADGPPALDYGQQYLSGHLSHDHNHAVENLWVAIPLSLDGESVGSLTLLFSSGQLSTILTAVTRNGWLIGALAMMLGGLVFLLLGRVLTANLKKMELAADAVSHGDYQTTLDIKSHDELATLGKAFNHMARQIETDRQQQHEREQHMIFTLNSIANGVVAVDNDGYIRQINPVACELTGWDAKAAIGESIESVIHLIDNNAEPVKPPVRQALESGKRVDLNDHTRLVAQDGSERPVKATANSIIDTHGQTVGAISVFRDNSEELLHQQQLQRQHDHLTTAETVANMGSWSRDLDNDELSWSPGFCRVMDFDPDDQPSIGQLISRFTTEDQKRIKLARASNDLAPLTVTLVREGGEVRQLQMTVRQFYDDRGKPQRLVGIIHDITERLAATRAGRESEQMLLSVINNAPALVVLKGRDGRILHSNIAHAAAFGMTPEQMIGKTSHDFHPGVEADQIVTRDQQVFTNGQAFEITETLFNGVEDRIFTSTRTPLIDETGGVYALVFFAWDITDQTRQQDQQRGQQKMEALGQLTGGVAHDYNNMLAIILGYAELLEIAVKDNALATSYVTEILNAGQRSALMTRKLLGFGQQQPGNSLPTKLNLLLEKNHKMLEKTATENVQLTLDLSAGLWLVELSTAEFEDALINLVMNAAQAMPKGGTLTIRTENRHLTARQLQKTKLSPGDYVLLSVIDSGIGMTQKTAERVLEPFFTTKGRKGTGLGLSQVYGFVQRENGDIQITSQPGKGSQFTLYFPRTSMVFKIAEEAPALPSADEFTLQAEGRILLVDDESALVDMGKEILTARGYSVTAVDSGKAALEELTTAISDESSPAGIDLLITDIVMPNMDGQRLAELAREQQPHLKVLFVSGFNQAAAIKLQPGYTDLLSKPFSANELLTKTQQMLDTPAHEDNNSADQ